MHGKAMRVDAKTPASNWRRWFLLAAIAASGVIGIVGSGGGGDGWCFDCVGTLPPPPSVSLGLSKRTAQAGTTVVFTATVTNATNPTYRWCRRQAGDTSCVEIAGATGSTYTLVGATPADDGATFQITMMGDSGPAFAQAVLLVSSMAPVIYSDGEFLDTDWTIAADLQPPLNGPTHTESRQTSGGNPGAYRAQTIDLPLAPSSARIYSLATKATYDPAVEGAIRSLDFAEDCLESPGKPVQPLLEQAGRRYTATSDFTTFCVSGSWESERRPSLEVGQFQLVAGPACSAGESCPDFSAAGAPLSFGYSAFVSLSSASPPGATAHYAFAVDNWQVTVWKR